MEIENQLACPLVSLHWKKLYRNPDTFAYRQIPGLVSFAGPVQIVIVLVVCFLFLFTAFSSQAGNCLFTAKGAGVKYVALLCLSLGHTDVKTTMIYTHCVQSKTVKEFKTLLAFDPLKSTGGINESGMLFAFIDNTAIKHNIHKKSV